MRKRSRHKKNKLLRELCLFIPLSLLASHIMVVKGEPYSQLEMVKMAAYYRALLSSTFIAVVLLLFIGTVNRKLDKRYPWEKGGWLRPVRQVIFGVMLTSVLALLLAWAYFLSNGVALGDTDYWQHDYLPIVLFITVVNFVYFAAFVYTFRLLPAWERQKQQTVREVRMLYTPRWKRQNLSPQKVVLYRLEDKHVFSYTREGEKSLLEGSLKKIHGQLDAAEFFRVNEQIIVHHSLILAVEKQDSGSRVLKLTLDSARYMSTTVSQARIATFKPWLRENGKHVKWH